MEYTNKPLHTIDVVAKEWFDKVNGNSYFSAQVTINFGMPDAETFAIPFQYGYESYYQEVAARELERRGIMPPNKVQLWQFCEASQPRIILRTSITPAKKKEVISWGQL